MINFSDQCGILGELWINYKEDKEFAAFIEYNDLGLPLAYMVAQGLVNEATPLGEQYINETFKLFISGIGLEEEDIEEGMDLSQVLEMADRRNKK